MNQLLLDAATKKGRPIPGQSLTTDPKNPAPYEKPPKFTSIHDASEHIFQRLMERDVYIPLMQVLSDGVPIMDITQTLLFKGFTEGKWTPDLMMLLVEPVTYMILALAERAEIDPVIYRGEDEDEAEEQELFGKEVNAEKLKQLKARLTSGKIPRGIITPEREQELEELPTITEVQSLLSSQKSEEDNMEGEESGSLLAPTEEVMQ